MGVGPLPAPTDELDTNEAPPPPDAGEQLRWRRQADEARQDLAAAKRRVEEAVSARGDAVGLATQSIEEAMPGPLLYPMAS